MLLGITYCALFLILFFSPEIADGTKKGISVSMNMLIPSLFCFMIFSNFIMKTKLKRVISFPLEKLFSKAFRLNSCESTIYLLSLIGGYPIGAKLISDLYAKGEIKKEKAERLLAFFVNCGPSFLISGIGAGLLGNVKIGVIIYLSELLASFIIGFIITRKTDISVSKTNESPSADFGIALTESVVDATKTMILICAYSVFLGSFTSDYAVLQELSSTAFADNQRGFGSYQRLLFYGCR